MTNIKLNTDGAESAGQVTEADDILSGLNPSQTNTDWSILPDCIMDMEITKVEKARNKTDTGDLLLIKMKTTVGKLPYSNQGDEIQPGFPCTTRIGITPTVDYSKSSIEKSVSSFVKAIDKNATSVLPLEQWVGKLAQVKVSYQPERNGYPAGNNFRFVPLQK